MRKKEPVRMRDIGYIARIDSITGEGKERQGSSQHYWYFGAARPMAVDDEFLMDAMHKQFERAVPGLGRKKYRWMGLAIVRWFLRKRMKPGIYGVPRQKEHGKQMTTRKLWYEMDLSIVLELKQ
ncbi:hypothetical protein HDV00_001621 [Rhizophlyctis rosea]|nr:hypothetical protein HDV00_001621 [Rhizophlyctis rosea]